MVVTDTITTTILPNDTMVLNFNQLFNFITPNTNYRMKAWTSIAGDTIYSNDTIINTIRNSMRLPGYFENFESYIDGSCGVSNWEDSIGDWSSFSRAGYAWALHDNGVCGSYSMVGATGPRYDHTLGNGTGTFMFVQSSGNSPKANLVSPCIDFSLDSAVELSFWYHKFGANMGDLFVDVFANGIWNMNVDSVIGQTHLSSISPWLNKVIGLNQFAGEIIQVRFRSPQSSNNNGLSNMAIDDVHFYNPLTVGAKEISIQEVFNLYPNPNNGNFNLNVSNELVGKQYQVFDVKGGLVKQARIDAPNSQIELSNAEKGVYFIKIEGYAKAERIVVL